VKAAGVSRGLLYHYFKDKQDLFDFLIYYSIKISIEDMEQRINWEESDFLNRLKQSMDLRFELVSRYPYMLDFYKQIGENKAVNAMKNKYYDGSTGFRKKFYEHNIDYSNVKDGTDIKKMVKVIRWTLKAIGAEHWDKVQTTGIEFRNEELMKEIDAYIEFLRDTFYK